MLFYLNTRKISDKVSVGIADRVGVADQADIFSIFKKKQKLNCKHEGVFSSENQSHYVEQQIIQESVVRYGKKIQHRSVVTVKRGKRCFVKFLVRFAFIKLAFLR